MKAKTQKNKFVLSSDLVTVEPEPIIYDIAVPAPKKAQQNKAHNDTRKNTC